MRIRDVNWVLVCIVAFLLFCCPSQVNAQLRIRIKTQVADSFSGIIVDLNRDPIAGVLIEETNENWTVTSRSMTTDATGAFKFTPVKGRKIYWIRISKYGFNPVETSIRVRWTHRKVLIIQLGVAM